MRSFLFKLKILIFEENEEDFNHLNSFLKESQMNIETKWASSYKEVKENVQKERFDILFVNLSSNQNQNNFLIQNYEEMRKGSVNSNLQIIAMIICDNYTLAREALKAGYRDILNKKEITIKDIKQSIKFAAYHLNLPERSLISSMVHN